VGVAALRAALLLLALVAWFYALSATAQRATPVYGRELVSQYELSAEHVARYRAHAESGARSRADPTPAVDPLQWVGPLQSVGVGRNPYTLVLSVGGVAPAAGEVRTHWQAGWEVQESPTATRTLLRPLAALSSGSVSAGTPLTLTVVGGAVSFRGERSVAPMLNLVQAKNVEIQTVRLAVWSGTAPWTWPQLSAPNLALLLLGALCAVAWWALRDLPLPAAATPDSTLPAAPLSTPLDVDLESLLAYADAPASAPPPLPSPPAPATPVLATHAARVVASLHDVLSVGLAVPAEPDPRRHGRKAHRGLSPG
jgi:hypothetical protein